MYITAIQRKNMSKPDALVEIYYGHKVAQAISNLFGL